VRGSPGPNVLGGMRLPGKKPELPLTQPELPLTPGPSPQGEGGFSECPLTPRPSPQGEGVKQFLTLQRPFVCDPPEFRKFWDAPANR